MNAALQLVEAKGEYLVDSRLIATYIGNKHQNTFELIKDYQSDFKELGILRFETGEIIGRGQPEKYALLNEDQSYLLLTYSRNTPKVRDLKIKLVKAFREARLAIDLKRQEYLPTYHQLHDEIHALAAGSDNERFVHMNVNRLVNKTTGIDSGQRNSLSLARRSLVVVANAVAANSFRGAKDHREGYARAKEALQPLQLCQLASQYLIDQK